MRKLCFLLIIIASLISENVSAFDNEITHPEITDKAIRSSSIDVYLTDNLVLPYGTGTIVKSLTIKEWLKKGSFLEDVPQCRASNHFHNPLKLWTHSGMSDQPWFVDRWCSGGEYPPYNITSAVHWATGYTEPAPDGAKQETNNQWDWEHAREHYFIYLTGTDFQGNPVATTKDQREEYFSMCFRSLGQVLHLLQDMAVPAHVKNDFKSHLDWVGITPDTLFSPKEWFRDKFEYFVEKHDEWITGSSGGNLTLPTLTKFWDTDEYNGENPLSSLDPEKIGLAEYANINFASKNTILTEDFLSDSDTSNDVYYHPYPRKESTDVDVVIAGNKPPETITDEDGKPDLRVYVAKTGHGEEIEHFATPTYFSNEITAVPDYDEGLFYDSLVIDRECAKDYASKLLPRAVGYSAGLLDYFFRGEIDMVPDDESGSGYVIKNKTEEDMEGTFEIYYDNTSDERVQLWSGDFTLGTLSSGNNKSSNIQFSDPDDAKEPGKYILVFRGGLGNEADAVVGKVVEVVKDLLLFIRLYAYGATAQCLVWDILEQKVATNIPKDSGGFASFPCDPTEISGWLDTTIDESAYLYAARERGEVEDLVARCSLSSGCGGWSDEGSCTDSVSSVSSCVDENGAPVTNIASFSKVASCGFVDRDPPESYCLWSDRTTNLDVTMEAKRRSSTPYREYLLDSTWYDILFGSIGLTANNVDWTLRTSIRTKKQKVSQITIHDIETGNVCYLPEGGYIQRDENHALTYTLISPFGIMGSVVLGGNLHIHINFSFPGWGAVEASVSKDSVKEDDADVRAVAWRYTSKSIAQLYFYQFIKASETRRCADYYGWLYMDDNAENCDWTITKKERITWIHAQAASVDNSQNMDPTSLPRTPGLETAVLNLVNSFYAVNGVPNDEILPFSKDFEIRR